MTKSTIVKLGVWSAVIVLIIAAIPASSRDTVRRETGSVLPSFPWPISTPEAQGLDPAVFQHVFREAERVPYLYSLLVVRNGYLVAERYFHLKDEEYAANVYSVSKSFTSALVGIALREGYLPSLDAKLMDYFPDYISPGMDARKFEITLRHLITMRGGFDFNESWEAWDPYWYSPDWVRYALNLPLIHKPGQAFAYSSVQTNLLSVILTRAAGMSTKDFAEKYLFAPLRISVRGWQQDPQGYYTGGHHMFFTPRDLARFGWLYLNSGRLDGLQIVPEEWVWETTQTISRPGYTWGFLSRIGYGAGWWTGVFDGYEFTYASGKYGQQIYLFPEWNMVVVTTMGECGWASDNAVHSLRLALYGILWPLRCLAGPPPYFPADVSARIMENRGLFLKEHLTRLSWAPHPRNAAVPINSYRIYALSNTGSRRMLAELPVGTATFLHRANQSETLVTYGICAVTVDGRESIPAVATVQFPASPNYADLDIPSRLGRG